MVAISFDVDDRLLKTYLFYSGVLVLKVLAMAVWTASLRLVNNVRLKKKQRETTNPA
jgi:hypothetical protein